MQLLCRTRPLGSTGEYGPASPLEGNGVALIPCLVVWFECRGHPGAEPTTPLAAIAQDLHISPKCVPADLPSIHLPEPRLSPSNQQELEMDSGVLQKLRLLRCDGHSQRMH